MGARRTVLLMSRGERLGALYSAIARQLTADHRVVAMIDESERRYWQDVGGVEAHTIWDVYGNKELPSNVGRDDFIRMLETETGMRVYQAARNYLLYGRLHSEVFGWRDRRWLWQDEEEIVSEYLRSWRALAWIFERYDPTLILLEAPDHIYASLAQAMAYRRGILCLGLYFAPLAGDCSMFLYTGFQPHNVLMRYYYDHPEAISASANETARAMIAKVRRSGPTQIAYVAQMRQRSQQVFAPMVRKAAGALMTPEQWGRLAPGQLKRRAGTLRKEMWLQQYLRRDIPEAPYVLWFMQHQPEASATTQAPHMIDQARVIEEIAVNAPAGWRIVVKEHPRTYPARGREYFRPLLDLPNVHLCHPSVDSHDLLARAAAIVTLTGSVGMEALLQGKPVAVVGRPYYAFFGAVAKLDRPGDLFDALQVPGAMQAKEADLERFAAAYYASVFDAGPLGPDGVWPEPVAGGVNIARALRRHLELLEAGAIRVADFPPSQR